MADFQIEDTTQHLACGHFAILNGGPQIEVAGQRKISPAGGDDRLKIKQARCLRRDLRNVPQNGERFLGTADFAQRSRIIRHQNRIARFHLERPF